MLWRSFWPRDPAKVSHIAGIRLTIWATREALYVKKQPIIVDYAKWYSFHGKKNVVL